MPPRYAYWTILIDNKPTAFRAARREELQPTFAQLKRTNKDVAMKWFARGRLWDTPEQAQWAGRNLDRSTEKRGRDWRPGGTHQDPRARFDRRKEQPAAERARPTHERPLPPRDEHRRAAPPAPPAPNDGTAGAGKRPWTPKPRGDKRGGAWRRDERPHGGRAREERPWQPKPPDSPRGDRPFEGRRESRGAERPWKPQSAGSQRPWKPKPQGGGAQRPWKPEARGGEGQRLWKPKGQSGGHGPWRPKPSTGAGPGPRSPKPPRDERGDEHREREARDRMKPRGAAPADQPRKRDSGSDDN
jgi:hypothetical protein